MRALLSFLLIAAPLAAEPATAPESTPAPAPPSPTTETETPAASDVVEVIVVGTPEELEKLRSVIGPRDFGSAGARWLRADRLDRDELLERREPASEVAVRCFVAISPGRAHLYFANRTAERFLVREVSLPQGLDSAGREAVGQVLSLSVTVLIEDAEAGLTRSETERLLGEPEKPPAAPLPKPKPAPRAAPRSTSSLGAAPFYAAKLYSNEVPLVHGPGMRVAWVTAREGSERAISLSFGYEVPERLRLQEIGLAWETTTFRGGVELLETLDGLGFTLGGRLGGGIDVVRFAPKGGTRPSDVALTPARTATVPVFTAAFAVGLAVTSRLSFGLELFADIHPVAFAYTLEGSSGVGDVFSPYRVRPGGAVYLAVR